MIFETVVLRRRLFSFGAITQGTCSHRRLHEIDIIPCSEVRLKETPGWLVSHWQYSSRAFHLEAKLIICAYRSEKVARMRATMLAKPTSDVNMRPQQQQPTPFKLDTNTSPTSRGSGGPSSPVHSQSRKRDVLSAGFDASPETADSDHHDDDDHHGRKRPVKRACNECRQQKLRCDVVSATTNYQACSRCRRLHLECKIDENFKRIGKRSRNAEMEREIIELRRQVAAQNAGNPLVMPLSHTQTAAVTNEAAAGLLDLRDGGRGGGGFRRLGDVMLHTDQIRALFERFFKFSHPFLPFLDTERPPEDFYTKSPLLFWTIALVGSRHYTAESHLFSSLARQVQNLTWSTLAEVPQNYHHIKALILLCAWPLPCSSTSADPTFMLCGMMMQIALQIGLHRPDHAQDFTKFRIELRQAEMQDRVVTWAMCNIVAQRIGTAYGQPTHTIYDWTLGPKPIQSNPNYKLPPEIYTRLQIERFVDKVSKMLYNNPHDPVGLPDDETRSQLVKLLGTDLSELAQKLNDDQTENQAITQIYLKSAALHLHLSAFFSHRDLSSYRTDMLALYHATTDLLEACLNLESEYNVKLPPSYSHGLSLSHGTNYIFHMMLAAGFSLLKLMHHFLPQHGLDIQGAAGLLTRTLWALRSASVLENDLPERLSEVLAQVWKSGPKPVEQGIDGEPEEPSDELQLNLKCRSSVSVVFDTVWRWRKNFRDQRPPPGKQFALEGKKICFTDWSSTILQNKRRRRPNRSDACCTGVYGEWWWEHVYSSTIDGHSKVDNDGNGNDICCPSSIHNPDYTRNGWHADWDRR